MKILLLLAASLIATPSFASECIDTDGDGWGWTGTKSCSVNGPPETGTQLPICEFPGVSDTDGDGFGWENSKSCRVDNSPTITPVVYNAINLDGVWNCERLVRIDGEYIPTFPGWELEFEGNKVANRIVDEGVDDDPTTVDWTFTPPTTTIGSETYSTTIFSSFNGTPTLTLYIANSDYGWGCRKANS